MRLKKREHMTKLKDLKKGTKNESRRPFVRIIVPTLTALGLIAKLAANFNGVSTAKPDDLKKGFKPPADTIVIIIKDSINIKKGS